MKGFHAIVLALLTTAPAVAAPGSFGDLHYRWVGPAVMGGRLDVVAGILLAVVALAIVYRARFKSVIARLL